MFSFIEFQNGRKNKAFREEILTRLFSEGGPLHLERNILMIYRLELVVKLVMEEFIVTTLVPIHSCTSGGRGKGKGVPIHSCTSGQDGQDTHTLVGQGDDGRIHRRAMRQLREGIK